VPESWLYGIWTLLQPKAVSVICDHRGPIGENPRRANLLDNDVQDGILVAIIVDEIINPSVIITPAVLQRTRAIERPGDDLEPGGFGGDGVRGRHDGARGVVGSDELPDGRGDDVDAAGGERR